MSSDTSDDEEIIKLREAADPQFINNAMFTNQKPNSSEEATPLPPSLRQVKDDDGQFNLFHVSPEFQGYVAKHLSAMLDKILEKKLQYKETNYDSNVKPKRRKAGIKLFKTSPHFVKLNTKLISPQPKKLVEKESIDDKELQLIAVSPEDILSQKETKHWSNRSKAPVFNYIKTKQGLLLK